MTHLSSQSPPALLLPALLTDCSPLTASPSAVELALPGPPTPTAPVDAELLAFSAARQSSQYHDAVGIDVNLGSKQ